MSTSLPFSELALDSGILSSLKKLGYQQATPIQVKSIPILMAGEDLLAQAQTGTGKTAAFALPAISRLAIKTKSPQVLVIVPTRELALQVSEAFRRYASHLKALRVASIYGGHDMRAQLNALKQGAHVVVGTPGRVMDHLRRGTLKMHTLSMVVLDEADEMLKMGFVEDVEWILSQIPNAHQTALFSATIPPSIQKIARRYQKNAAKISIKSAKISLDTIEQRYMLLAQQKKTQALLRFLEVEPRDATIIFTRTKLSSIELAQKLHGCGYAVAALNGDMKQTLRQKAIKQIKSGVLDVIVATDVAARGIDVGRVSHVVNYDMPADTETYLHRIGRTGRAGRRGCALLLVTPREQRLLTAIERGICQKLTRVEPPSQEAIHQKRSELISDKIHQLLQKNKRLKPHYRLVNRIMEKNGCEAKDVAAGLSYLLGDESLQR